VYGYSNNMPFQPKSHIFWLIAAFWDIFGHLFSEMVAEPPIHRGPLHAHAQSASDSTAHEQFFSPRGEKVPLLLLFKNISE
jgi:hypothetical protein